MLYRIAFMGNPIYALNVLRSILEEKDFQCLALFCNRDKVVGRKKILTPPLTKQYILDNKLDIEIYQPNTLKDSKLIDKIKNLNLDFIIVAAYGKILPKEFLDITTCINLHGSILPKYRGASPLQESILNLDDTTGVTSMLMSEGMDEGDILKIVKLKLKGNEDTEYLMNTCGNLAGKLLVDTIKEFQIIKPLKQDSLKATYCKKIKKEDGQILLDDALIVYAKYRAFKVWPNIFLCNGVKLNKIALNEESSSNEEGKILQINKDYIVIGCLKGSIKVYKMQKPSKKEIDAIDFIRGERLNIGNNIF